MKSIIKLTLSICVSLTTLQACASFIPGNEKIIGNGDIVSKVIETGDYDEIKVKGNMTVSLNAGKEGNISLKTDENLGDYIDVFVEDDALTIRIKKGYSLKSEFGIKLNVPFEDLSKVSLAGSGDIISSDPISSSDFQVNLAGSGDIKLVLEAREVNANIAGSGDVHLRGTCRLLKTDLAGSGDFHGLDLKSEEADLDIAGSGDVRVNASEKIKARIAGSGDVHYVGKPEDIDSKVIGSGSIREYRGK